MNIIFVGTCGVGKTTVIKQLINKLSNMLINYIPAFIDALHEAKNKLDNMLSDKITRFEFQKYVLQYYDDTLSKTNNDNNNVINIFERLPDDTVALFCEKAYKEGKLTYTEFNQLQQYSHEINKKYNLPCYYTNENRNNLMVCSSWYSNYIVVRKPNQLPKINSVDNNFTLLETIIDIIVSNKNQKQFLKIDNLFVFIFEEPTVCLSRINARGIVAEKRYTLKDIERFDEYHKQLYKIISEDDVFVFNRY